MGRPLSIAAGVHPDLEPERTVDQEPIIPALDHDDHGERVIETAARLGVRHVLFTSRLPDLAATCDRFAELCGVASRVGVHLVCEFLPIFPLKSLAMALEVVAPHSPEVAGVLVDNLHLSRSGARPDELRNVDSQRLPYVQIADAPRDAPTEFMELLDEALNGRLVPCEGALPIAELLTVIPDVPLSFEVRSRALREDFTDPVERARFVLDRVRSCAIEALM